MDFFAILGNGNLNLRIATQWQHLAAHVAIKEIALAF